MSTSSVHFICRLLQFPRRRDPWASRRSALWEKPRDVPHLAAGPRLCLAVDMDGRAILLGELAPFLNIGPDQVGHDRIAVARGLSERPAANRPHVIFELADEAGVERPMA